MVEAGIAQAPRARLPGLLLMATGIASIVLLGAHPGGGAREFADILKEEAANRLEDAIVHGGFVFVLTVQLACYAIFSAKLGLERAAVIGGLVFFVVGAAMLGSAIATDGLVIPAIAAKYVAMPEKIDYARSLFVYGGAWIGVLMPMGLAFQGIGIASWGASLFGGPNRAVAVGALGAAIGIGVVGAVAATVGQASPMVIMGGIAATTLWALAAGAVLWSR